MAKSTLIIQQIVAVVKLTVKVVTFRLGVSTYSRLNDLCVMPNYDYISECVREAMKMWLETTTKKLLDAQKHHIMTKIIAVRIDENEYNKFKYQCIKLGYHFVSDCIREAIELWIAQKQGEINEI